MAAKRTFLSVLHSPSKAMNSQSNSCKIRVVISQFHSTVVQSITRSKSRSINPSCRNLNWKITESLPFIYQAMRHKSRLPNPKKLTIRPKSVSAQPRVRAQNRKDMRVTSDQIGTNYLDGIEVPPDNFEEQAHAITTYGDRLKGMEANNMFWRDMVSFQRMIRTKTLENKYFRPPKKPNLLTWAAKEQMRYLNYHDPEEWNVETLAQTFPVGTKSSRKIISSGIRLRRLQEILEHDLYVKRNWEIILMNLKANKVDSENIVKDFLENLHSINIIQNVLPVPDLDKPRINKKSREGAFSLIVKDALQKKDDEETKQTEKLRQLHLILSEILSEVKDHLIQEIESKEDSEKYNKKIKVSDSQESLKAVIQSRFGEIPDDGECGKRYSADVLSFEAEVRTDAPRKISTIDPNEQNKLYSYQVDDCVYDENGEFLYRMP